MMYFFSFSGLSDAIPANFTITQLPKEFAFSAADPNLTLKISIQSKPDSKDVYFMGFQDLAPDGCSFAFFLFVGFNESQIANANLDSYRSVDFCTINMGSIQGQFMGFWNLK